MKSRFILSLYPKFFAKKGFYKINLLLYELALRGLGVNNCNRYDGENWLAKYLIKNYKLKTIFDLEIESVVIADSTEACQIAGLIQYDSASHLNCIIHVIF